MRKLFILIASALAVLASVLQAQVPQLLNYQGRVVVDGVNFDGAGQFKFALVDGAGENAYWSNDGSLEDAIVLTDEPAEAVALTVSKGLYSVLLGDTALSNMGTIPVGVFANADVRLRVWFDDGAYGFQLLTPDQRIAAVGYAVTAGSMGVSSLYAAPMRPVVAWGENGSGQTTVPEFSQVTHIAAGAEHSLALLGDGSVEAWGGDDARQATVPDGLGGVIAIAAGVAHSLAVKADGSVVAWGSDGSPQSTVPAEALADVKAVAAGQSHSLSLKTDGSVVAWGDDTYGQATVPGGLADVTAIACGYDHCLALKADGTVEAWGRDDALGYDASGVRIPGGQASVPVSLNGVIAIAAGAFHSLAVKGDGTVVAWGWDLGGQSSVPGDLADVVAVAGGYSHSAALKRDGRVVSWGDDALGQTDVPARLSDVIAIAATGSHTLALRAPRVPALVARLDEKNTFLEPVGIGRVATKNMLEVEGPASKAIAGNWSSNSDRRIKEEIEPVSGALEALDAVRLVSFRYTEAYRTTHPAVGGGRYLNVIAQEFAQVFPEHVRPSGEFLPDGSEILQVDTYPLTIYAAAAVQELNRKLVESEAELAALKERLARLEGMMSQPSGVAGK